MSESTPVTPDLVTAGPWKCAPRGDGWHITAETKGQWTSIAIVHGMRPDNAKAICALPDLLALARQYANECGDCAGTRIQPDDTPCTECSDIWTVIEKAAGKS